MDGREKMVKKKSKRECKRTVERRERVVKLKGVSNECRGIERREN